MSPEPHWLEQRFKYAFPKNFGKPTDANGTDHEPSAINGNLDRYIAAALIGVLSDLRNSTEGNRNETLNKSAYRLGRFVGGNHLDENIARAQLDHAARVCGLRNDEIARTIRSGLEAGKLEPFTLDGNDYRPHDTTPQEETTTELPQPANWATILGDTSPEVDWLIDGIIERGRLHALFAPSKTHKSLMVQFLSAELARSTVVMYLDFENSRADLRTRFLDMGHSPESLANLLYFQFPPLAALDTHSGGAQLVSMANYYKPELIVIDTTSRVISGPEDKSDTFRALYRVALQHIKAKGIAVLRIDHAGKDVALGQRGSSAKADDVDTVWLLIRQDDDRFSLKCTHQRSGNHPEVVNFRKLLDPLRFTRLDDNGPVKAGPLSVDQIIAELDRLKLDVGLGGDKAFKILQDTGRNVRLRTVRQAVADRKASAGLMFDAAETPTAEAKSRHFRQDHLEPSHSPSHSQDELSNSPAQDPSHSVAVGQSGVTWGVPEVAKSGTEGYVVPPVTWRTDPGASGRPDFVDKVERAAMEQLAKNGIRMRIVDG